MEGQFALGRFYQLSPEQLHFVETFIRCEGKITRVEGELGISYPTVRNRLHEVIRALGHEVREERPISTKERKAVLEELAEGEITPEEAIELLKSWICPNGDHYHFHRDDAIIALYGCVPDGGIGPL